MLTKAQLFDASRCFHSDDIGICKKCTMQTSEMGCIIEVIDTAIELLKENEKLKGDRNE